nr:MAG TPA: hypothetical protein [Caudoviricetes sp.]
MDTQFRIIVEFYIISFTKFYILVNDCSIFYLY